MGWDEDELFSLLSMIMDVTRRESNWRAAPLSLNLSTLIYASFNTTTLIHHLFEELAGFYP